MRYNSIILVVVICLFVIAIIGIIVQKRKESGNIVIGFAGDVMIGRMVNEIIDKTGYEYPWGNLLPLLHATDLNIVNLETTLTKETKVVPKVFNFKAAPDRIEILKNARIDAVNIANNHILDFGVQGMIDTIEQLDLAEIAHVGSGQGLQAAQKPAIFERNGLRIGIIGATDNEPDWAAEEFKPGVFYVNIENIKPLCDEVKKLRPKVDLLILTIHWGPNWREHPSQEFINAAHSLIDCGVDIIHGSSAHILQGIEIYKRRLIMYGTGDFVDDYQVDPVLRNDCSAFFEVTVDKNNIKQVQLIPVLINDMQVNIAQGEEKHTIIDRMEQLSQELGTSIDDQGIIIIK